MKPSVSWPRVEKDYSRARWEAGRTSVSYVKTCGAGKVPLATGLWGPCLAGLGDTSD